MTPLKSCPKPTFLHIRSSWNVWFISDEGTEWALNKDDHHSTLKLFGQAQLLQLCSSWIRCEHYRWLEHEKELHNNACCQPNKLSHSSWLPAAHVHVSRVKTSSQKSLDQCDLHVTLQSSLGLKNDALNQNKVGMKLSPKCFFML